MGLFFLAVSFQRRQERIGPVMFFLVRDVFLYAGYQRAIDGEDAMSALPLERRSRWHLMRYEVGRNAFQLFHQIAHGDSGREAYQHVNVVFSSANAKNGAT